MEESRIRQRFQTGGRVMIVAGEGEGPGRWVPFKGRRTMRAIRMRLKKERCHGDRWAMALLRFNYKPSTGKAEWAGYWVDLESGQVHWDIRYDR
jgi:hypothetical protein